VLGEAIEVVTAHTRGTFCDDLAIDGVGTIAGLGLTAHGVGLWTSELQFVSGSDGAVLRGPFDAQHLVVFAGEDGFLAFHDPNEVALYAHDGSTVAETTISWGMRLIASRRTWGYSGFAGAWADPAGGFLVAVVGASDGGDVELRVAGVGPMGELSPSLFVVASRSRPRASILPCHGRAPLPRPRRSPRPGRSPARARRSLSRLRPGHEAARGRAPRARGDTVRLELAHNPGAFLSLGAALPERTRRHLFTFGAGLVVVGTLCVALHRRSSSRAALAAALLAGGGAGNLWDRLATGGYVIDFLNAGVGPVRTGIFNVADVALMAGALLLLLPRRRAGGARG
jgi:signal peptidase II